jgi:hypothetical protein
MQNKNNLNVNVGEHYGATTNNPPLEKFSVENVPIHSMKKDLEMIANPSLLRPESSSSATPNFQSASASKISPFLERPDSVLAGPPSQKKPENLAVQSILEQSLETEESTSSKKDALKKVLVFSIIFLSLIALGVGSYYFWLVRGKEAEPIAEEPLAVPPAAEPSLPAAVVEPEIKIAEPKENTLVLDLANSTPAKIKLEIKNQIEKLPKESFDKPLEFKLRDSKNNLIDFSLFAKKSGLTFAQSLSTYLGESFSLLVFNDGSNLGTGLIIESKNDLPLAQELRKKETALPKDLNVIFLAAMPQAIKKVSFSDSTYKDISLRYFNLISPEKLSIDYAVAKNKLIIGTTRNTFLAFYDWLSLKLNTQ